MQEETLENIKSEYDRLKTLKKDVEKKIENNEHLDRTTIEYFEILENINANILNKKDTIPDNAILSKAIDSAVHVDDETNHIYVYIGTYMTSHTLEVNKRDYRVFYNHGAADYRVYNDIEKPLEKASIKVPIEKAAEFEEKNIVLFYQGFDTKHYYFNIRSEYFKDCMELGEEEAIKNVLEKRKPVILDYKHW